VPANRAAAAERNSGFERRPQSENAFHRYGEGNEGNEKFMSKDRAREAVYNVNGELVTDPTNAGTYNYGTNPVTHTIFDVAPYLAFGNGDGDRTSFRRRVTTLANAGKSALPSVPKTDARSCARTGAMCD
jgi:hypothetical protein